MFTLATFQRYNELTALEAAGVPKSRIVKPVIVAVVALAAVAVANRELVIPRIRERFNTNAQNLGGEAARQFDSRRDYKTDILIRGKQTIIKGQRIHRPTFVLPFHLATYGRQLLADDAFYRPADANHPAGYLLQHVTLPKELATKPSLSLDGQPIVLTPRDYPWLAADECFVVSDVTFEYLASAADWRQNASLLELIGGLRNPSLGFGADARVALHSRVVQPFLDVTLLFLGLPLVLSRNNRNLFLAIGLCVVVVVVFYLAVLGLQYLGSSYMISPALAAWLPLIIFVPAAVALSDPLRE
jgi:lipopolysaccharide export system permease protein